MTMSSRRVWWFQLQQPKSSHIPQACLVQRFIRQHGGRPQVAIDTTLEKMPFADQKKHEIKGWVQPI
jgi:hypothetical protein